MWGFVFDHVPPVYDWNIIPQLVGISANSLLSVESLSVIENLLLATLGSFTGLISAEVVAEMDLQDFNRVISETEGMLTRIHELRLLANRRSRQV